MLSRGGAVICGVGHAQYQLLLRFGIGILCGCFHCALAFSCWLPRQLTGNGSSLWAVFFFLWTSLLIRSWVIYRKRFKTPAVCDSDGFIVVCMHAFVVDSQSCSHFALPCCCVVIMLALCMPLFLRRNHARIF